MSQQYTGQHPGASAKLHSSHAENLYTYNLFSESVSIRL